MAMNFNSSNLDDEITHWYLIGCHILQHPKLDKFNKEKFASFLETLNRMVEA